MPAAAIVAATAAAASSLPPRPAPPRPAPPHGHLRYVFYFCWWVQEGFQRTYRRKILDGFWPLPHVLALPIAHMSMDMGRMRGSYRKKARSVLGEELIPAGRAEVSLLSTQ